METTHQNPFNPNFTNILSTPQVCDFMRSSTMGEIPYRPKAMHYFTDKLQLVAAVLVEFPSIELNLMIFPNGKLFRLSARNDFQSVVAYIGDFEKGLIAPNSERHQAVIEMLKKAWL